MWWTCHTPTYNRFYIFLSIFFRKRDRWRSHARVTISWDWEVSLTIIWNASYGVAAINLEKLFVASFYRIIYEWPELKRNYIQTSPWWINSQSIDYIFILNEYQRAEKDEKRKGSAISHTVKKSCLFENAFWYGGWVCIILRFSQEKTILSFSILWLVMLIENQTRCEWPYSHKLF